MYSCCGGCRSLLSLEGPRRVNGRSLTCTNGRSDPRPNRKGGRFLAGRALLAHAYDLTTQTYSIGTQRVGTNHLCRYASTPKYTFVSYRISTRSPTA